jgi:hypothetical protein
VDQGGQGSDPPEPIKDWPLTSLKEKLIKTGAKIVSHGRYVAFQMAEVDIPRTGGPARGCASRNAETSVIKTHVSRGFSWNARPNALRYRCNGWRPQLRDQPQDVGKETRRIYKPRRGLNDISVLSKSRHGRNLVVE